MEGATTPVGGPGGGELRPLDVGESIGAAISLYRKNLLKAVTIAAAVITPIEIVVTVIRRVALPSDVWLQNGSLYTASGTQSSGVALLVAGVLNLLGVLLVTGAVFHLLLDARLGRAADLAEAFAHAWHRMGSLLWLGIVVTVMVFVGFVLIIIPGIWLLVATSVAIPVLMLEGLKGTQAASRSISLVQGRWWATFGTLLLALILYIVGIVLIAVIGAGLASAAPTITCPAQAQGAGLSGSCHDVTVYEIITGVISAVIYILLAPFWASVVTVIYVDLRVRKEGLDHVTLADRSRAPGTTVPFADAPAFPAAGPPPDPPAPPPPGGV